MNAGHPNYVGSDQFSALLRNATIFNLRAAIASDVPARQLGAPVVSYSITSMHCVPGQRLIVGLTSSMSLHTIAVTIFLNGGLLEEFALARRQNPRHAFISYALSAVIWVFPGDSRLNLTVMADTNQLKEIFSKTDRLELKSLVLARYIPEHTYRVRASFVRVNGMPATKDITIFRDLRGANAVGLIRQLGAQSHGSGLVLPEYASYLARHLLLIQSALPPSGQEPMADSIAARALARLHRMTAVGVGEYDRDHCSRLRIVQEMITFSRPNSAPFLLEATAKIRAALQHTRSARHVLLHGAASESTLHTQKHGRVGISRFDAMCWGPPEIDLAGYYALKLRRAMRHNSNTASVIAAFPDFVDSYNQHAANPVDLFRSFAMLAYKLLTSLIACYPVEFETQDRNELHDLLITTSLCIHESMRMTTRSGISMADFTPPAPRSSRKEIAPPQARLSVDGTL